MINYDIEGLNKTLLKFIHETNNININKQKIKEDINIFFNNILNQSIDTSIVIKSIVQFFRSNDIIVNKFLLNLSILICVIEEFLKKEIDHIFMLNQLLNVNVNLNNNAG